MSDRNSGFFVTTVLIAAAALFLSPLGVLAQSTAAPASSNQSTTSVSKDRWLHVRVISSDARGETVRVNVPLELAEKVLPAINKHRLHEGKIKIDDTHVNDVDLRALVDAIRTTKDGEFVTVQSKDCDVRVAKQNNHLIVHVLDKRSEEHTSELQSRLHLVCRLLLEKKNNIHYTHLTRS